MTKNFCDICGKAAISFERAISGELPVGEPYNEVGMTYTPIPNRIQCNATATVVFGFRLHPRGFLGPPDLCPTHARELIQKALESIRDET